MVDRDERIAVVRAAFPPGMCGWYQRNARRFSDAMCPRCWRELGAAARADYLRIDGSFIDAAYLRARWILAHRPPPLLELRRPPRRRRTRNGLG